jgi:hypothetical protein
MGNVVKGSEICVVQETAYNKTPLSPVEESNVSGTESTAAKRPSRSGTFRAAQLSKKIPKYLARQLEFDS